MSNTTRRGLVSDAFWLLVTLAIVVAGVIGFRVMGALREPVVAAPIERTVPLVETVALIPHAGPIPVAGEGFVRSARTVQLASEAPGRVVELAPALPRRGRVAAGEVLARIDARGAEAQLARALADRDATRARLDLNATSLARTESLRRRGMVSQEELDRLEAEASELAGRMASLEAGLRAAEVTLEATRIVAPFDGRVLNASVEVGDVIGAGQAVATLYSPDALEVTVPLQERVAALIPGLFAGAEVPATVTTRFAGSELVFDATLDRVAGALDAATRTLDVTVRLTAPGAPRTLRGPALPAGRPPALVNAWADVRLDGAATGSVHALPSAAVRQNDTVWLVADGTLSIAPVEVLQTEGGLRYVRFENPPRDGAQLVTSVLATPVHGMAVRVQDPADAAGDGAGDGAVDGANDDPGAGTAARAASALDLGAAR